MKVFEPTGESLAGVRLFKELAGPDREAIANQCQGRRFPVGLELVHDGDQTDEVYFVVSGKVRATIFAASGKEVAFRDLGPGDSVGDLSAIDGRARSATVVALAETMVISMSSDAFWSVLLRYPSVTKTMLMDLTTAIRDLSERVVEYSTLGVKNRLHAELLRLAVDAEDQGDGASIRPAPTHAEIASRISTHREAVTRELRHLSTMGLLERRDGALVVRDVARLTKMVDDVKGV